MYGIARVCLTTYTTISTIVTIASTTDGSTLPLIIFNSLFIFELKVPPSSTLFFLLKALLGESMAAFFLFFNGIYISSLVFLTLTNGFCGLSF